MYPTYVPILKAKAGEFAALKNLKAAYSEKIAPFFRDSYFSKKRKRAKMAHGINTAFDRSSAKNG
jgi:hypothetical protein